MLLAFFCRMNLSLTSFSDITRTFLKSTFWNEGKKTERKLFSFKLLCLFSSSSSFLSDPLIARTKLETLSECFDLKRFWNFNSFISPHSLFFFVSITELNYLTIKVVKNNTRLDSMKFLCPCTYKSEHVDEWNVKVPKLDMTSGVLF